MNDNPKIQNEIDIVRKFANVTPDKITFHDKGFLSRGYVISNGEIVFKFPKYPHVNYENEVITLDFLREQNFSEILDINLQRVNKDWTDTSTYRHIGFYGVPGESIADLQRKSAQLDTHYIGTQLGKFLSKMHEQNKATTIGETLEDEINRDIEIWKNMDTDAKEFLNQHFTKSDQTLINKLVTQYVPAELRKLGEQLVYSHSDIHEGNVFIDSKEKVGIIDFDNAGFYDAARDFARMDNDDILSAMLNTYGANESLRKKIEIRRDIVRPFTMLARLLFPEDYIEKAKDTVEKYKNLL